MSLYQKLTKVMDDRDVEGYVALIHEDAEIVFHKSVTNSRKLNGPIWSLV